MNHKNTILAAVLINAGLLVVLFMSALSSPVELGYSSNQNLALTKKNDVPLFGDDLDLALRQTVQEKALELPKVVPETSSVVHTLPPPVQTPSFALEDPSHLSSHERQESDFSSVFHEVTVKRGDTLEKIARNQQTTVDVIIKFNHLPSSFLRVGQVLKIPNEKKIAVSKNISSDTTLDYYTVKVGDNPWSIAMKNNMKVDELLKLNSLNEEKARRLKAGDRLKIR
jgi:peptidoglycan endopeptidase LytF